MSFFSKKEAKTQAWALFIQSITGKYPKIKRHDDYNQIVLNENQIRQLQNYFSKMLSAKPGDVRVNLNPVLAPVVIKKYLGWFIGIPAGLMILGGLLKGRAIKGAR